MPKPQSRKDQVKALQDLEQGDRPKVGRPSMFTEELAAYICGRLSAGDTLTDICLIPGLPAPGTVHRWRREHSQFDLDYTRARVDQMECWSDEIINISDDSSMDTVTKRDPKGREFEAIDHENIQRSRLMVDTRKFLMAKIAPQYADKLAHEHSGEVHQRHTIEFSDRERMRRLATFMLQDRLASAEDGVTIDVQPDKPAGISPPAKPAERTISDQQAESPDENK